MKKKGIIFILLVSTLCARPSKAQTIQDIFFPTVPVTWFGIDFTEARYFGDPGTVDPAEMVNLYSKINFLLISEPEKYDFAKFFYKKNLVPNLEMMQQHNSKTDASKIISFDLGEYNRMDAEFIKKMVERMNFSKGSGLGLLFVMEGLNKTSDKAAMWVTYFNIETKQVLLTTRMEGKPGGFGFRNFWARSVLDVMERVYKSEYKRWRKEFGN